MTTCGSTTCLISRGLTLALGTTTTSVAVAGAAATGLEDAVGVVGAQDGVAVAGEAEVGVGSAIPTWRRLLTGMTDVAVAAGAAGAVVAVGTEMVARMAMMAEMVARMAMRAVGVVSLGSRAAQEMMARVTAGAAPEEAVAAAAWAAGIRPTTTQCPHQAMAVEQCR